MHTLRLHVVAAALLLAGTAAPAVAQPSAGCTPRYTPPAGVTAQPNIVQASNTPLAMVIAPDRATVGGCTFGRNLYQVAGYPGGYIPPTLRIEPGATLQLSVVNAMSTDPARVDTIYHGTTTNFHFHGFNVTPGRSGGSQNQGDQVVTVAYDAGAVHPYRFTLPADHPMGMHWYHPHPHAFTDEQVGGGMSGAFLVGDLRRTRLPKDTDMPERVLLFKDFQPGGPNGSAASVFTINGDWPAVFTLPAGTAQLWHTGNVGSDTYAGLALLDSAAVYAAGRISGNVVDSAYVAAGVAGDSAFVLPFIVLGMDGNGLVKADTVTSLDLSPAVRYSAVVQAPYRPGQTYLMVNTASSFAANGMGSVLGKLRLTGPGTDAKPITINRDTDAARKIAALKAARLTGARRFVFSTDSALSVNDIDVAFRINDQAYDHHRIDAYVELGSVEEWTLVNADTSTFVRSPHVFHIHQGDFLVTSRNGSPLPANVLQDRLSIAPGDSIVVRIPFNEGFQAGIYVFHCHILFHEDHGMMKNVCVYPGLRERGGRLTGQQWCDAQLATAGM